MPATVQASEAADRLRKIIRPGETVRVIGRGTTRSGVKKVTVHAARQNITADTARLLGLHLVPRACILHTGSPSHLADRLSVALFGEPGQIKGEYL